MLSGLSFFSGCRVKGRSAGRYMASSASLIRFAGTLSRMTGRLSLKLFYSLALPRLPLTSTRTSAALIKERR